MSNPGLVEIGTLIGEWAIAFAIYLEFGGARLDRFYEVASDQKSWDQRNQIYAAICSKSNMDPKLFASELSANVELRKACDRQISLLSMIGEQLPVYPPRKRLVLSWFPHAVVILWYFLSDHVAKRRITGGKNWAIGFETLARACAGYLLKEVDTVEVWDPNSGKTVHTLIRDVLEGVRDGLKPSTT